MEGQEFLVTNGNVAYTMIFTLVFLLVIAVNVVLLIIYIRNPVLISPSQLLYINLSCSNIALALFSLAFGVVTLISNKWIFPSLICQLVGFFNTCFIHMTLLTAFHVLNERYHCMMNGRRHGRLYTVRRVGASIAGFWVVSVVISALPFIPGLGSYTYHPHVGTCYSPTSLLGFIPALSNLIYLVLWCFLTFNLLTLPSIPLPESLKHKRAKETIFLPQLFTSSTYTLAALVSVIFTVLDKSGVLSLTATGVLERSALLLSYLSTILLPVCNVVLCPELRRALTEIVRKGGDPSKYEQIDQTQPHVVVPPEFSKNAVEGHVTYPEKGQMMPAPGPPHTRGYPRPVYTRPMRYDVYHGDQQPYDPRLDQARTLHPDQARTLHPDSRVLVQQRGVRQVQRSHSTVGYLPRHHRTLHPGQRSQSLNRVADPQGGMEMSAMKQQSTSTTPRPKPKAGEKPSGSSTKGSSVASSSTVADIVDI